MEQAKQPNMTVFEFGITDGRKGSIELNFTQGYFIKFENHKCGPYKSENIALSVLKRIKFEKRVA